MLRRTASASAAMLSSGYRQGKAAGPCTESLGSESGDVGGVEIEQLQLSALVATAGEDDEVGHGAGMVEELQNKNSAGEGLRGERRLPPVMPRPAEAFMRAERRGGRLILTQVARPVERPREVFRASRAGGRLRLRFAEEERCCDDEQEHKAAAASRLPRQRTEPWPVAAATAWGFAKQRPAHRGASTSAPGWGYDDGGDEVSRVVSHACLGSRAAAGFGLGSSLLLPKMH